MLPLSPGEAMLRPCPKPGFGRQRRKHGLRTPKIHLKRSYFSLNFTFCNPEIRSSVQRIALYSKRSI
jgi:hypothetical protein